MRSGLNRKNRVCRWLLAAGALGWSLGALAVTRDEVVAWIATPGPAVPPDAGRVLTQADMETVRMLQPPAWAQEYDFPELKMEIQPTADWKPHPVYAAATQKFAGQAKLGPQGVLENYTAGRPFSDEQIRAASPEDAGLMLGWNRMFRWQYYGWSQPELTMNYIKAETPGAEGRLNEGLKGGGDVQRYLVQNYQRVYLNHLAWMEGNGYQAEADDVETRLHKDYVEFLEPTDVKGTKFVVERMLDALEEDQVNSYLPTQRRVRRLSAQERADTYMGSDMTLDDFESFSGRVLDYDWKLLGEHDVLAVFDSRTPLSVYFGPQSRVPLDRWQVRHCWVVEARPKWQGHPYSAKILFIDKQSYNISAGIAFNRKDEAWRLFGVIYHVPQQKSGEKESLETSVPLWVGTIATDALANTSTVSVSNQPTTTPTMNRRAIKRRFDHSSLGEGR